MERAGKITVRPDTGTGASTKLLAPQTHIHVRPRHALEDNLVGVFPGGFHALIGLVERLPAGNDPTPAGVKSNPQSAILFQFGSRKRSPVGLISRLDHGNAPRLSRSSNNSAFPEYTARRLWMERINALTNFCRRPRVHAGHGRGLTGP